MFNKKIIMILTIFIVSLFAISAVSAADNATNDVVSVEETTNDETVEVNDNQGIDVRVQINENDETEDIKLYDTLMINQDSSGSNGLQYTNSVNDDTLDIATLFTPFYAYSVSISDTVINYDESINIKITPASSDYDWKYDFYLNVYDSNNNKVFSRVLLSQEPKNYAYYTIHSDDIKPGTYTMKIINYHDEIVMSTAKLTIKYPYPSSSDYSVRITDTTINYGSKGVIRMSISPASTYYKYYYHLKVLDSHNNEKISKLYYFHIPTDYLVYNIGSNQLSSGTYTMKIINYDDGKLMDTATLTVKSNEATVNPTNNKPIPNVVVPPLDKPSADGSVPINLPSDATGTVTLVIGGKAYSYSVVNGVANVYMPDLNNGNYDYTLTYSGDGKYSTFTNTGSVKINKIIPTVLTASPVTTVYNGGKDLVITLKDVNGKPVSGATVTVVLGGKTYTPNTDKNGQVKVTTNGLKPVKKYTATITFKGNSKYDKSSTTAKVKVNKAYPKFKYSAATFKRTDKKKKYTIRFLTNQNIAMKYTKVYIKVNNKLYYAKTNKKGYATFSLKKLTKKGTYKAKIMYYGDAFYNPLTTKVKLTVK